MMMDPEEYGRSIENRSYLDLIRLREKLMMAVHEFEQQEISGRRNSGDRNFCPAPETKYRMHLEYLGEICRVMNRKYNREYVHGYGSLREDSERMTTGG